MSGSNENDYDILSGKNDKFLVTFDLYTPRAHFVIMARDRHRWSDIQEMARGDKQQVLRTALDVVEALGLGEATLSIHRGGWVNTKHFHCHVCTDVNKYLSVFEDLSRRRPMSLWWPNKKFVNRQWKASKDMNKYAANVSGYPYGSYKAEEVSDIEEQGRCPGAGLTKIGEYPVVYHSQERRIGILMTGGFRSDVDSLYTLLEVLEALKSELGIKEGVKGGPGCHVCLDLTGKGFSGFEKDRDTPPVYGYLQVPGPMMYRACPAGQRDAWLARYKDPAFQDKVYT